MNHISDDIRVAVRRLFATPGFTLATIISIALGVGVNATVFAAANTLLIQPMRAPRADELVRLYNGHHSPFNFREFDELRRETHSFSQVFAETQLRASLSLGSAEPERARISLVSSNTFVGMELVPALGRLFTVGDDRVEGPTPELVLAQHFWHERFGADSSVIGREVRINARAFVIVGVAPERFVSTQQSWRADAFVPIHDARALLGTAPDSLQGSLYVSARLLRGVTIDQATADVDQYSARVRLADSVTHRGFHVSVRPARGIPEELRLPAAIASAFLLAISLLVLVIAATNVGNLTLARNAARRREIGVRLALGASTARIVRHLLVESLLLAGMAGLAAILMTQWTTALLPQILPSDLDEVWFDLAPDWRVTAFAVVVLALGVVLFGLIPARHAARLDVSEGIRQGSAIGGGTEATRLRRRFLLVQVALSALLLTTGSLFVRSLANAGRVQLGFRPQGIMMAELDLQGRAIAPAERSLFFRRVLEEARQLPGVQGGTLSMIAELTGSNAETGVLAQDASDTLAIRSTYFNAVGPDYHATLGIPLVRGRDIRSSDVATAPGVAVVNETYAARTWPGLDPIGRRISFSGASGPWFEVVGVAATVKYHTLGEEAKAFVVVPEAQQGASRVWIELRLAPGVSSRDVGTSLSRIVRTLDPALAPPTPRLMVDEQRVVLLPARVGASLLGGIGVLAFILAALGVSGVAAYSVTQRTREIGVRVALGATRAALLRSVLGDTWRVVRTGAMVGLILAAGVARLIQSQLYGVSWLDPLTFVAVPFLLVAMAVLAVFIPARRAIAVQPTEALRGD